MPRSTSLDAECDAPPPMPTDVPAFDKAPDPRTSNNATWTATLATNCGDITLEIDGEAAPQTVASFIHLARQKYWVDSPCHRLTSEGIFVLQCGDPTGTSRGGPGYTYGLENVPEDGRYPAGTVAMARGQDPDSNGGQFFIVYDDTVLPPATGGYTVFGKVTGGMDTLNRVVGHGVEHGGADGRPAQPISILNVDVAEKKA